MKGDAATVVAVDLGGTHARFALARLLHGQRPQLGPVFTCRTAEHAGLASAWAAFSGWCPEPLPAAASIAIAAALGGELIRFPNNAWVIRPAELAAELGVARAHVLNDFAAVAHAVAWLEPGELRHLHGPAALPAQGVTTIVGLGTGLGVAQLLRTASGYEVLATEGGHGDFAPLDAIEDQILARLRERFVRVSDERVVCGPALAHLYEAIAAIGGHAIRPRSDAALWDAALDGSDPVAVTALERLVRCFGSVAGDLVLQHGANQLIVTGGIANRIASLLSGPLFHGRFCAKGRYAARMETFPIRLATHEQPGLLGAAAAYSREAL